MFLVFVINLTHLNLTFYNPNLFTRFESFTSSQMQADKQRNPSSALKKIATNMEANRKSMDVHSSNIVNTISGHKDSFNEIESLVRYQTTSIDSMKQFTKQTVTETSKNLQSKRIFLSLMDKSRQEIKSYMQIIQETFIPSYKPSMLSDVNTSGGRKAVADMTNSPTNTAAEQSWNKIHKDLEKNLSALEEESVQSIEKMFEGISKLSGVKENFLSQIMKIMVYQKNILWRDLNAPYDDYIHGEVKAIINEIKSNEEKLGYIPSKLKFDPIRFDNIKSDGEYLQLIRIHLQDFNEVTEGLKNYSKLNGQEQVIQDISKNEHIVKGLRQRIQRLTINYENLLERYRNLQISKVPTNKMTSSQTASEEKSLLERLQEMQGYLVKKEQEILQFRQATLKSDGTIQALKDKNKELEDQLSKYQKYQQPKIKELEANQKNIMDEFIKVKRDLQTYTNIVSIEREEKLKLVEDLQGEKKRVNELAFILGRQRRKIKDLKVELNSKEQIIMELVDELPDQVTKEKVQKK